MSTLYVTFYGHESDWMSSDTADEHDEIMAEFAEFGQTYLSKHFDNHTVVFVAETPPSGQTSRAWEFESDDDDIDIEEIENDFSEWISHDIWEAFWNNRATK